MRETTVPLHGGPAHGQEVTVGAWPDGTPQGWVLVAVRHGRPVVIRLDPSVLREGQAWTAYELAWATDGQDGGRWVYEATGEVRRAATSRRRPQAT